MNTLALYLALFMLAVGSAIVIGLALVAGILLFAFVRGCFMPAEKDGGVR